MAKWFRRRSSGDPFDLEDVFDDYDVPNFPGAVHEVLRTIREDESSNADIARSLENDPGMSVRTLRLVNSAGFGLRQPVDDVSQAVQLIGRSSLESILISVAVKETLPTKPSVGFSPRAFWRLSAQRAGIAGRMASELNPADRSLHWTAALLQDLAIPLLVERLGEPYRETLAAWVEGHEPLDHLEREAFGIDHSEIGRKVCERWEFPERLTQVIAEHHAEPTLETAAARLVAYLRPSSSAEDDEPAGVADLIEAAATIGMDPESCELHVTQGLSDAAPLISLLG